MAATYQSGQWTEQDFATLEQYTFAIPRPLRWFETQEQDQRTSMPQATDAGGSGTGNRQDQAPTSPTDDADGVPVVSSAGTNDPISLSTLIGWLETEAMEKELRARAGAYQQLEHEAAADASLGGLLHGHGLEGQPALDAYVSDIVAALRDFPYEKLSKGREAGAWVRDEVIAPTFKGHWDFYSNRKRLGYDPLALDHLFNGKNMLLEKLQYVRQSTNL